MNNIKDIFTKLMVLYTLSLPTALMYTVVDFVSHIGKEVISHSYHVGVCFIENTISSVFWSQVTNWSAWGSQTVQKHVVAMNITTVSGVTAPRAISTSSTQICTFTTRISEKEWNLISTENLGNFVSQNSPINSSSQSHWKQPCVFAHVPWNEQSSSLPENSSMSVR